MTVDPAMDHLVDARRMRVVAAHDTAGMNPAEAVALFASISALGSEIASARRRLVHVGALEPELAHLMRVFDVECVEVKRVDDRIPHLNKLRMLENNNDVDFVLMLDTDIVMLGDPLPFMRMDAIAAKPVDQSPLSDADWETLFGEFDLAVPAGRHLTSFHAQTVPAYFNSGVVGVPVHLAPRLLTRWFTMSVDLLDRYDTLPQSIKAHRFFTDQFGLALALEAERLPVRALPISCNYPTNAPLHPIHEPDQICPLVLHHHHQLRADGTLALPVHASARAAVARFNDRLTSPKVPSPGDESGTDLGSLRSFIRAYSGNHDERGLDRWALPFLRQSNALKLLRRARTAYFRK